MNFVHGKKSHYSTLLILFFQPGPFQYVGCMSYQLNLFYAETT